MSWIRNGWSSGAVAPDQVAMVESGKVRRQAADGWDETEYDKTEQVNATGCMGGEDETPGQCGYIKKLKFDLANSYYWSGNFVRDYFFFVMQWHPLLSIFMCHPNHPWTKEQRFWMFLISAGLTFIPSCAISKVFEGGPDVAVLETTTPAFAVDGAAPVSATQAVVGAAQQGSIVVATILFVTIPDTILGVILYQLAISETRCGACPMCIPVGKCVMKYTLVIAFVVCGVNFAIGMAFLQGHPPVEALEVMCYGKLWSYGTWFIIWLLLPCQLGFISLWTYERKEEARKESAAE